MAAAARLGDICTGHGCFPPRAGASASNNVFINSIRAHRLNDAWHVHCCDGSCHASRVASGSGTVFINGRPAARIGDNIACGSLIAQGSNNVFIGDGSAGAGATRGATTA